MIGMSSCEVCCSKFNKTKHKEVRCPHCVLKACRACAQRYLMESVDDPHCMGCKTAWSKEILDANFTRVFIDRDYRTRRRDVLFEREKAFFPEAQIEVERTREVRRARDALKLARDEFFVLFRANALVFGEITLGEMRMTYPSVYMAHENLMRAEREVERLNQVRQRELASVGARNFTRKCPSEKCQGFLDTEWYCSLCETNFCRACNDPVDGSNHACDPNAVETMRLIETDSKPCVKCGVVIQKLEGCRQMWCPNCRTAFDWETGEVASGRIHNPHYLEHRRRHGIVGREHGDIPCGGAPMFTELLDLIEDEKGEPLLFYNYSRMDIEREMEFLWNPENHPDDRTIRSIRVWYLLGEYPEKVYKDELYRREKEKQKRKEVHAIMQTYVDGFADELRQFVLEPSRLEATIHNMVQITDIVNNALADVRHRYRCSRPKRIKTHAQAL